jgi:hypothetical protein
MDDGVFPATIRFGGADFAVSYQEVPEDSWVRGETTFPEHLRAARWVAKTMARLDRQRGMRPCHEPGDTAKGTPVVGFGLTPGEAAKALAVKLQEMAAEVLAYQARHAK